MFSPTHNDHFQFGFNNEPWKEYQHVDDEFFVRYGRPIFTEITWRRANRLAARLIAAAAQKINKHPAICLSGGVDSQIVALAFKDAGIRLELWHFDTGHPYETIIARQFAEQHNFPLREVKINVADFFQSGRHKLYNLLPATHGTYELHCYFMELVCGQQLLPIFGESSLTRRIGNTWTVGEGYTYKATSRYAHRRRLDVVPTFFNYLPDQTYAYCKTQFMKELTTNQLHNMVILDQKDVAFLPSLFHGTTVHHVKMKLVKDEYPEVIMVRKQRGNEHLIDAPYYRDHLGPERTKEWGDYMKKHYLRFDMFEPKKLIDYFEDRAPLSDARVARQSSDFWSYPE